MAYPLVSVCIPVYNGEKYLKECLDSVIVQTYKNIEIIIVDDRSNDNSEKIIREYVKKDNRIKLFINEKNLGLVGNWNQCLRLSSGEWIKYIFQDDYLANNCISRMIEFANSSVQLITCNRKFVFEKGLDETLKKEYILGVLTPQKVFKINKPAYIDAEQISRAVARWITSNFIGEPAVALIRKSIISELGYFHRHLVQICDLEYWLRISTNHGMVYIPETLAFFRVHAESTTSDNRINRLDLADKMVLMNELLLGNNYSNFRKHLNYLGWLRFKERVKLILYEGYRWIEKNSPVKLTMRIQMLKEEIPQLKQMNENSLTTRVLMPFLKIRRLLQKMY